MHAKYEVCMSMNTELAKLIEWINVNKLSLNVSKTNYIIFSSKGKPSTTNLSVMVGESVVKEVKHTKFLGVTIDCKLIWNEHTRNARNKISKNIGIICKAKKSLNVSTLITLYNSFIYPHLIYGIEVWG